MRRLCHVLPIAALALTMILAANTMSEAQSSNPDAEAAAAFFSRLEGDWTGMSKTWFKPGELADESEVTGHFEKLGTGNFVRHTYTGSMMGKDRVGDETLAFNAVTSKYQSVFTDSFHMNYAFLFSEGDATENGFAVTGKYDVGPGIPQWGWRTEYALVDEDHLVITCYNITPEGEEAKGVEVDYHRVK